MLHLSCKIKKQHVHACDLFTSNHLAWLWRERLNTYFRNISSCNHFKNISSSCNQTFLQFTRNNNFTTQYWNNIVSLHNIVIIIRQFTLHKIAVTMSCGSIWMMGNTLKKFNLKKSEIVNNAILVHYSIYTGSWTAE